MKIKEMIHCWSGRSSQKWVYNDGKESHNNLNNNSKFIQGAVIVKPQRVDNHENVCWHILHTEHDKKNKKTKKYSNK